MACSVFHLLMCVLLGEMAQPTHLKSSSSVHQDSHFISAETGDYLTLSCFFEGDVHTRLYWYKQTLGQKPRIISTYSKYDKNATFYDEFKNDPRFTLDMKNGQKHLAITDLRTSDSATYYCVRLYAYKFEFAEGITVSVKGSVLNIPVLVHQSTSETIQPGGSVSLNCTVHTGTCDGEHSVYWFKNSEESHPGLIYTQGGRNDQCEKKPNTQTHTCVYNLAMKTLNLSHAETYYCAVALCGNIVFGNGTTLKIQDWVEFLTLVSFSTALTFTTIVVVLLLVSMYKMKKRKSCQSIESKASLPASPTANAEGYQEADNIHYAALNVSLPHRARRQWNNTSNECVYSSVKT